MEARAFVGPVVRSAMDVPAKFLVEVRNPFSVKMIEDRSFQRGKLSFLFDSTVPCYVTTYWGVSVLSIENAVAKEQSTTQNSDRGDDDDDDYDDDENNLDADEEEFTQIIPFERILSGSYESKGPMEYYNPGKEYVADVQILSEFESQLAASSTQQGNQTFPLVFVIERSRNLSHEEKKKVKSCDIVALITTLCCSKSSPDNKTFSIASQYVQTANGNIFPLKKLFVSDSQSSQSDATSSNNGMDSSLASDTSLTSATCVICHSMAVSRVLLPCRHACVCGLCFSKLEAKCPMCRQWIQSYFVTLEEPELTSTELATSRELNQMSTREILGGIFRAS
ncbi:uncharacterized protein LOC116305480 isoform X2 [Actinia tenebrosa]|nr:uncharacterized protein LOC116305480 isoform X2 [Actinia tenebrosa]